MISNILTGLFVIVMIALFAAIAVPFAILLATFIMAKPLTFVTLVVAAWVIGFLVKKVW